MTPTGHVARPMMPPKTESIGLDLDLDEARKPRNSPCSGGT
jgi:hypothetical protein